MEADQMPVCRQPYVALKPFGALIESGDIGPESVLGIGGAGATMRNDLWPRSLHGSIQPQVGVDLVGDPVESVGGGDQA